MAPTLPPSVRSLVDAANAGDREALLDCFAPQGAVDDWGRRFTGRSAIGGWSDAEFVGKRVSLDVTGATTTGATTAVVARVGGDGFNGPSTFTVTVGDEGVTLMAITA